MLPDALVFPVGQFVHDTEPAEEENVPGWQVPQAEAATAEENDPAAHLAQLADPSGANLPRVQSMHVETDTAPSSAEYVPATQAILSKTPPEQ